MCDVYCRDLFLSRCLQMNDLLGGGEVGHELIDFTFSTYGCLVNTVLPYIWFNRHLVQHSKINQLEVINVWQIELHVWGNDPTCIKLCIASCTNNCHESFQMSTARFQLVDTGMFETDMTCPLPVNEKYICGFPTPSLTWNWQWTYYVQLVHFTWLCVSLSYLLNIY